MSSAVTLDDLRIITRALDAVEDGTRIEDVPRAVRRLVDAQSAFVPTAVADFAETLARFAIKAGGGSR